MSTFTDRSWDGCCWVPVQWSCHAWSGAEAGVVSPCATWSSDLCLNTPCRPGQYSRCPLLLETHSTEGKAWETQLLTTARGLPSTPQAVFQELPNTYALSFLSELPRVSIKISCITSCAFTWWTRQSLLCTKPLKFRPGRTSLTTQSTHEERRSDSRFHTGRQKLWLHGRGALKRWCGIDPSGAPCLSEHCLRGHLAMWELKDSSQLTESNSLQAGAAACNAQP